MSASPANPAAKGPAVPPPLPPKKSNLLLKIFGGLGVLVGICIFAGLSYIGTMGPETYAVSGEGLKSVHKQRIKDLGLLREGEKIRWFYSGALFDIREDMTFLTDERLVVYRKHEEPKAKWVAFTNIVSVSIDEDDGFWEDSLIEVTFLTEKESDDDEWWIWVSNEKGRDRTFYEFIRDRHRPDRAPDASNPELQKALTKWMNEGGQLFEILGDLGETRIKSPDDAKLIVKGLKSISFKKPHEGPPFGSDCRTLAAFFEQTATDDVWYEFTESGLPEFRRLLQEGVIQSKDRESDLFYLMSMLAWYEQEEDVAIIAKLARSGFESDNFRWTTVFGKYDEESRQWKGFIDSLRDPLPTKFVAIAYLDAANDLAVEGLLKQHPFDTSAGVRRLITWLTSTNEDHFSYAHSAAVAMAFLREESRRPLVKIAEKHPDENVRIECAWAMAKAGDDEGVKRLSKWALDVGRSSTARRYLKELGHEGRIPKAALHEDFIAKSEMVDWLSHPNEFGRVPDKIEQFDSRTLHWPPTDDKRKVWLFRYTYLEEGEKPDVGLGMYGSVTFALFGENTAELSAEEAYGLHCAWELSYDDDERAPEKTDAQSGLKILRKHNDEL